MSDFDFTFEPPRESFFHMPPPMVAQSIFKVIFLHADRPRATSDKCIECGLPFRAGQALYLLFTPKQQYPYAAHLDCLDPEDAAEIEQMYHLKLTAFGVGGYRLDPQGGQSVQAFESSQEKDA